MSRNNIIHVALPSDQNYFPGLIVTVYSMAKYASENAELVFHILDGGICDASFEQMENAVKRVHAASRFVRHKMSEQDFSAFPTFHGNRMTYVRYVLPALLHEEDFVIYADSDCLWLADVAELWSLRDEGVVLKATFDAYGDESERPWFEAKGLPWSAGRYFCNGLLLMNLRLFRAKEVVERATRFLLEHPDVQYADQTAFNAVLGAETEIISGRWNVFTRTIGDNCCVRDPVLHYATRLPWRDSCWTDALPPCKRLWHGVYCEATGYAYSKGCLFALFLHKLLLDSLLAYALSFRVFRWPLFGVLKLFKKQNYIESLSFFLGNHGKVGSVR